MPIRKITNEDGIWTQAPCRDSDHNPPTMIVLEPGLYEHTCPSCKKKTHFRIEAIKL